MRTSRRIRFADFMGAGASMVLGSAGMLLGSALFAAEACTPAACTPTSPSCQQCDQVFADAAAKLKNLDPGCCTTAPACAAPASMGCAPTASVCEPDAVFGCGEKAGLGGFTIMSMFDDGCGGNALADRGFFVDGWTSYGYSNNPDGSFRGNAQALDDRQEWDRFALDQQYFRFGKAADGSCGLDFGFGVDLLYGLDGNDAQSFGNNPGTYDFGNGWDHGSYEWAMPQLYVEAAMGNMKVKAGHFYTIVGYEVLPATGNFFSSRQLTFYNSEPFTHTGVLTEYAAGENLTIWNGWVAGWDTGFEQLNDSSSYLGGFSWNINDDVNFIWTVNAGNLGWRGDGVVNSAILSLQWTEKLSTVHQLDVLQTNLTFAPFPNVLPNFQRGVNFANQGVAGDSTGQINYAFYDINDKVKAGVRQEWYKADGTSYYTFTYGVNVKPMENLTIRPEVRHMWAPGNNNTYGDGEDLYNQTVFTVDAVLTY